MKRLAISVKAICLGLAVCALASCANSDSAASKPSASADAPANSADNGILQIRYIDGDSIAEHYNLAKDYKDITIRALSNIENAQRNKAAEIQKLGTDIENKMRNNQYTSEADYNKDVQRFNKMQNDAQSYIAGFQRRAQSEDERLQQQLTDSIQSFINDYVKEKGFDVVLYKAAGVYFNPALDVTDEVIEGLNKRYTKVSEK